MNTKSPIVLGLAAVVIIVLLFGAWRIMGNNTATAPTMSPETSATPEAMMSEEMVVALTGQNDSGEAGTATLKEENGQTVVTITTTGFAPGVSQPAHIHLGSCPTPGEVKYPLTNVVDGSSATTLAVPLSEIKAGLPLAVNVHKSENEISVYTSCGDLPSN